MTFEKFIYAMMFSWYLQGWSEWRGFVRCEGGEGYGVEKEEREEEGDGVCRLGCDDEKSW